MKLKKIPYYSVLGLLSLGSSITLGLLSFAGMVAFLTPLLSYGIFLPIIPLAIAAFVLSIAYEGEIYLQNIKDFFKHFFKPNYLRNLIAREYLLKHLVSNLDEDDCPLFFKDYAEKLKQLHRYSHKSLDKQSQKDKEAIKKTLKDMENVLALALFGKAKIGKSAYFLELSQWLKRKNHYHEWRARLGQRRFYLRGAHVFSVIAGIFTGLGMPFLIADIIASSAIIASIPFGVWMVLIPICMVASAMVTARSITKFINNDTVRKWCRKIYQGWANNGLTLRNVLVTLGVSTLLVLAGLLTVCTGGTWLTVASNPDAIIQWVTKLPAFVMGIINPIIVVISSGFFNVQNIAETLDLMERGENPFKTLKNALINIYHQLKDKENWFQRLNPFRLILKLTVTPLRILLFLGHLLSIAVSTDRVPGISEIVAIIIALINEGFEDAHYFVKEVHDHSHNHDDPNHVHVHPLQEALDDYLDFSHEGHNHDTDIPTFIIKTLFSPIYFAAALWDWAASHLNKTNGKPVLKFKQAFKKQMGIEEEEVPRSQAPLSESWLREHADYRVEKFKNNHFKNLFACDSANAEGKIAGLKQLQKDIRNPQLNLQTTLKKAQSIEVLNQNRLLVHRRCTKTCQKAIELPERIFNHNIMVS